MEDEMGIRILGTKEGCDIAAGLASKKELIPFFGAGFTANCKARKGVCPDGKSLTQIMQGLILKYNPGITPEYFEKLSPVGGLSRSFFSMVPATAYRQFFLDYFTEIKLENYKYDFLNRIDWPRAYTTNFDNAIESCGGFQAIVPYKNYKDYVIKKKPLYKVHGDAYVEATDGTCEGVAFRNSWVDNLKPEKNGDFIEKLLFDFSNSSMIYVGCGRISGRIRDIYRSGSPDPNKPHMIVRDNVPTAGEENILSTYGISQVVLVDKYDDFYKTFIESYLKYERKTAIVCKI